MTEPNETPDLATDDAEGHLRREDVNDADDTEGHARREDAEDATTPRATSAARTLTTPTTDGHIVRD
jgi:hypothetical protein